MSGLRASILDPKVKKGGPESVKRDPEGLRPSIWCLELKKGGPEFVKRGPEGLSLFKITPQKACPYAYLAKYA